ncbi:unnamed protein product [Owenia fusiformis]|uniref:Sortilin-related receptor n=1 Tax=Owenia fusiformis TaxID=6347 RepID=A0A8J1TUR9_OWEFU|nr:unnamed protein product [Owenia fusiformis]
MSAKKMNFLVVFLSTLLAFSAALRYGSKSRTLHFSSVRTEDRYGKGFYEISRSKRENVYFSSRNRRSAGAADQLNITTTFNLNDSHFQLIVHWAGEGSNVIIALAKDFFTRSTSNSTVYISNDYGKSFNTVPNNKFRMAVSGHAIIEKFYNSPVRNSHYVFTDVLHNYIFTSTNYGRTFRGYHVPFRPKTISMHPTDASIILGLDDESSTKRLYVSRNFGFSWQSIQVNVKSFFWGVVPYDSVNTIYVERREQRSSKSDVVKSSNFFTTTTAVLSQVEDFEVKGNYLFATRNISFLGWLSFHRRSSLQLWVSHNHTEWHRAVFPGRLKENDYYIADASEDQVFVVVNHASNNSKLYISQAKGKDFTLSLERIFYYNPHKNNDSWLSYFAEEPFADIHKVEGLEGIFIASQVDGNYSSTTGDFVNVTTVITYDKGALWQKLSAPRLDSNKQPKHCHSWHGCSLHLSQKLQQFYPRTRTIPILSKKSAVGLIMATGTTNTTISKKTEFDVYLSNDGGYRWNEVLKGQYFYAFGDHGGVIVAAKQNGSTNEIRYSLNEGETWTSYVFSPYKIHIYGLLTEPGEKTTIFTLFGSNPSRHSWLVVTINLQQVLGTQCVADDYKDWSPGDAYAGVYSSCLLGEKVTYERRRTHSLCYNGRDYDREISTSPCPCSRVDFECDFCFKLKQEWSSECVKDNDECGTIDTHAIPGYCHEGAYYNRTRGYRKVSGDKCQGGEEHRYNPDILSCPVAEREEFLLYTTRTAIYETIFGNNRTMLLQGGLSRTIAVEFDYKLNCLYWADSHYDNISRKCLDGNGAAETLVAGEITSIEGLALDWMSGNIYWVDGGKRKIEMSRLDGRFRRKVWQSSIITDKPRAIVLDPVHGYFFWTDWSVINPRISKAWLDGTNNRTIVSGKQNVYWPNGITIDFQSEKIWWTDAHLDRIMSSDYNGQNRVILVSGSYNVPHPYSISVYKDSVYWTDWNKAAIMTSNKYVGHVEYFKRGLRGIMDMKIMHRATQQGSNICSTRNNGDCTHLCVGQPQTFNPHGKNRTCLCPDALQKGKAADMHSEQCLCPAGQQFGENGDCIENSSNGTCSPTQFACFNGSQCIPLTWKCDHDGDCSDRSDELNCPYNSCQPEQFRCEDSGRCLPSRWKCDHDNDCADGSDERGCDHVYPTCNVNQFTCNNSRCIPQRWLCDGDDDCHDFSDEMNCNISTTPTAAPQTCAANQFTCKHSRRTCVPIAWKCDGDSDCDDGSDEKGCTNRTCADYQFECHNQRCIPKRWQCDGADDCHDKSDESGCTTVVPNMTTTPSLSYCTLFHFRCRNRNCVWWKQKCDGINDCGDFSDEEGCSVGTTVIPCTRWQFTCGNGQCVPIYEKCDGVENCEDSSDETNCGSVTTVAPVGTCSPYDFNCYNSSYTHCIYQSWVCDGTPDCHNGEDELDCDETEDCASPNFKCEESDGCIPGSWVCDGAPDCSDGSDERMCGGNPITTEVPIQNSSYVPTICRYDEFTCHSSSQCVELSSVCDGYSDCFDNSDENLPRCRDNLKVRMLSYDKYHVEANNFTITWMKPLNMRSSQNLYSYRIQKSFHDENGNHESNYTIGNIKYTSNRTSYMLKNLKPGTRYQVTVSVVFNHTIVFDSVGPVIVKTKEGVPSKPRHVVAHVTGDQVAVDNVDMSVLVSWQPPAKPNGFINQYKVYYSANDTGAPILMLYTTSLSTIISNLDWKKKYIIYVSALTSQGEGEKSDDVTVGATPLGIPSLESDEIKSTYIHIKWKPVPNAVGYKISYSSNEPGVTCTIENDINKVEANLTGLVQGVTYQVVVRAYDKLETGPALYMNYKTNGTKMPMITNVTVASIGKTEFNVSWPVPNGVPADVEYTVYYTDEELDDCDIEKKALKKTVKRFNDAIISSGLHACSDYFILVQITKPKGPMPFNYKVAGVTAQDLIAPVKDVKVVITNDITSVIVYWNVSCETGFRRPMAYVMSFTNLEKLKNGALTTQPSNKTHWSYTVRNLIPNTRYRLSIHADVKGAKYTKPIVFSTNQYQAPVGFKGEHLQDGNLYFDWENLEGVPEKNAQYQLCIANTTNPSDTFRDLNFTDCRDTTSSSKTVKDLIYGHIYFFKVRYVGHTSAGQPEYGAWSNTWKEPWWKAVPSAPQNSNISKSVWIPAVAAVGGIVIVALIVVVIVFVVRHHRLQRSFLSFANSHYDTRTGATTFSSGDDWAEEEEPMIRGFSDDEPLVIA